jgi:hypothetical protein
MSSWNRPRFALTVSNRLLVAVAARVRPDELELRVTGAVSRPDDVLASAARSHSTEERPASMEIRCSPAALWRQRSTGSRG